MINKNLYALKKAYRKMRINQVVHLKSEIGESKVYPHKFHVSISMTEFVEKYSHLANEQVHDDKVSLAGTRINSLNMLIE